jgi:hypothetical protein
VTDELNSKLEKVREEQDAQYQQNQELMTQLQIFEANEKCTIRQLKQMGKQEKSDSENLKKKDEEIKNL